MNKPLYQCPLYIENLHHAKRIESFWHSQGYPQVKAWVENEVKIIDTDSGQRAVNTPVVRSNLVNGKPPR